MSKQVKYLPAHTDVFAKRHSFTRVGYLHICHFFVVVGAESISHTDVFDEFTAFIHITY